jgi:Tfp pilus assembly protein PilF
MEAEAVYRDTLKRYPKHFDARSLLGTIYAQRGDCEEAIRQIDLALRINPKVAYAHNNRGSALLNLKNFKEALKSFDRAFNARRFSLSAMTSSTVTRCAYPGSPTRKAHNLRRRMMAVWRQGSMLSI